MADIIPSDVIERLAADECWQPQCGMQREHGFPCYHDLAREVKEERVQKAAVRRQGVLRWGEEHKRAAVAEERERCAKVADMIAVGEGSGAEGQNEPEFSRRLHGESIAREIAAAIRRGPEQPKPTRHEPNAEVES